MMLWIETVVPRLNHRWEGCQARTSIGRVTPSTLAVSHDTLPPSSMDSLGHWISIRFCAFGHSASFAFSVPITPLGVARTFMFVKFLKEVMIVSRDRPWLGDGLSSVIDQAERTSSTSRLLKSKVPNELLDLRIVPV